MEQPSLRDYALIGDCRSAALISRFGSIDWLCWPRFDSASFFAAILDPERGGFWRIAPTEAFRSQRRYLPESNVLETTLETAQGAIRIVDAMSIASEEDESKLLFPEHEIVRFVECSRGKLGFWVDLQSKCLILRSDARLEIRGDRVLGRQRLRAGDALRFSLSFNSNAPAELRPLEQVTLAIDRTVAWWRSWIGKAKYDGPNRDAVLRSALLL